MEPSPSAYIYKKLPQQSLSEHFRRSRNDSDSSRSREFTVSSYLLVMSEATPTVTSKTSQCELNKNDIHIHDKMDREGS